MALTSPKPQTFKKWTLLLFSLIAGIVWVRNLLVFLPGETADLPDNAEAATNGAVVDRIPVWPSYFDDSTGWSSPFDPPAFRSSVHHTDSPAHQTRSLPKLPPEPPPWKLTGVVWNEKDPAAILASQHGERLIVVSNGDTVGPSRIEKIDQFNIWIKHDGRSWKLAINEDDSIQAHR